MKVWDLKSSNTVVLSLDNINIEKETACTIGNFDGIHTGHISILQTLKQVVSELNLISVVITFNPHPRKILYPESFKCGIINLQTKIYLLQQESIDYVAVIEFSEGFYKKSPEEFMDFLREKFLCRKIVIGRDWRFGYNKAGDINFAKSYGQKIGIDLLTVDDVISDGERVSSSRIRELLREGDIKKAKKLLGRDYFLRERVVKGNQIGRQIGFPTINFKPEEDLCLKKGVYAGFVQIKAEKLPAVINYGHRPTVDGKNLLIEAHVIQDNITVKVEEGEYVNIFFIEYIRQEVMFSSLEELKTQISLDIQAAKEVLFDA